MHALVVLLGGEMEQEAVGSKSVAAPLLVAVQRSGPPSPVIHQAELHLLLRCRQCRRTRFLWGWSRGLCGRLGARRWHCWRGWTALR